MDNLTGMAVFAAVVEAKSFSAAAGRLGMSKSAVSKQISRLEDRLGARLLNRTTRRLSLTEVGETFYGHCVRVLQEADAAEQAVSELSDEPRGRLRINAPTSFGIIHLARAVPDFMARYPELRIDLSLTDRFVDLVDEGFDVAIRITQMADSSLIARRLAPCRHVVVASPDYLATIGPPETPADLSHHNCLRYTLHGQESHWRFDGPGGPADIAVEGSFGSDNGEMLMAAAEAGLGVLMVPTFIAAEALRHGRLKPVLGAYQMPDTGINAVFPHRRHLSPKVRAFVDFLAGRFGDPPYWDQPGRPMVNTVSTTV